LKVKFKPKMFLLKTKLVCHSKYLPRVKNPRIEKYEYFNLLSFDVKNK
jgi:hypothetical protein